MKISKGFLVVLIVIIVLLLVGAGVWVGVTIISNNSSQNALSPYSAVYLSTGDIYFGQLSWLPSPHMKDAWFLQRGTDSRGNPTINVYPFNQVAWGPSNEVYFNSSQIIFWTCLNATSSIAQLIADPVAVTAAVESAVQTSAPSVTTTTPAATSSTSTVGR